MTPTPNRIIAAITLLSVTACQARVGIDEPDPADASSDGDTGGSDDGARSETPTEIDEVPPPAHFSEFGVDLDEADLAPRTTRVTATATGAIDSRFDRLEITQTLFIDPDAPGGLAVRLSVDGLGDSCGEAGIPLVEYDTRDGGLLVAPPEELADAITQDLAQVPVATACDSKDGADAAPPAAGNPGNAGFFGLPLCVAQSNTETAAHGAFTIGIQLSQIFHLSGWRAACNAIPEPASLQQCNALLNTIVANLNNAVIRVNSAHFFAELARTRTQEAQQIAVQLGLGAIRRAANWADAQRLIEIAFQVEGFGRYGRNQAAIATGLVGEAVALTWFHPTLTAARPILAGHSTTAGLYLAAHGNLAHCLERVAWFIAMGGALGFGLGLFGGGGGGGGGPGPAAVGPGADPKFFDGGELLYGPLLPHAWAVQPDDVLVVDVAALTTLQTAMSRRESGAIVSHEMFAGYELPADDATTAGDIIVPEPLTGLPIVAVPAGSPVVLGSGGAGGDPQFVATGVYDGGMVRLGGAGRSLVFQEIDEDLQPMSPLWAVCEGVELMYCPLGMQTTQPPDVVGTQLSRWWRIWSTGGTVDPRTGDVVDPMVGFVLNLRAPAEGPSSHCYVWDGDSYEFEPWQPGCGPSGGGPGGGPGGPQG